MKHLIIIPAYNEEDNIGRVITSLVRQTQLPAKLIIVDDGSSDKTAAIVEGWAKNHMWIQLVQNKHKEKRAHGSKIVRAFNLGLNTANIQNYDTISKFDADLEFPENYLESLTKEFNINPRLGLAGGNIVIKKKDAWIAERLTKNDHVNGAVKTYRQSAFNEIGGLLESMGWDTADEFKLRFREWSVQKMLVLQVYHYRETYKEVSWLNAAKRNSHIYHNLRYGLVVGIMSSLKRGLKYKPFMLSGLVTLYYFLSGFLTNKKPLLTKQEGSFARSYRIKNAGK